MVQIKDKCKLSAEKIKLELSRTAEEYRANAKKAAEDSSLSEEHRLAAIAFGENAAEAMDAFLLKLALELDAEEVKRELMYQIGELLVKGHQTMKNGSLSDEEKLPVIRYTANASAAICTFLTKIGVEIRAASGLMLWDSLGFFAWEQTLKINLMRKKRAAEAAI